MSDGSWEESSPQGTKKRVNDYVASHPGEHIRRIARELGLGMGGLRYHLHSLEKEGLIKTRRNGFYRFVYPSKIFGERQEIILSLLSQETPSEIILFLVQNSGSTQKDLAEHLTLSPATISWHMGRMIREGVIGRTKTGKFVEYRVNASADEIFRFVESYHPTIWEKWASRLADLVLLLGTKEGKPQ
jgi:predicted transcriptional regulator